MLATMTIDQLYDWQAFWEVEPFGDDWRRTGVLASMIGNVHAKRGKQFTPDDFVPRPTRPKVMTGPQICAVMNAAVANTARAKNGKK